MSESEEQTKVPVLPSWDSVKENKTGLASVYADPRAPVATVKPAIFNGEVFALEHRKVYGRHSCVEMGKPCSRSKAKHMQRQGKKQCIQGGTGQVWGELEEVWKGNSRVEP